MLIVHGLGRSASEWSVWAAQGSLVPDLPELRRTDAKPDFQRVIRSLRLQLSERGIARTTWLGHSGGAHLALEVAMRYPELVDRLIVLAAAPPRGVLAAVGCQVLVVLGALEGLRVEAAPHVQVSVLAGVGHDPHLEAPDELRDLIRRWRGS